MGAAIRLLLAAILGQAPPEAQADVLLLKDGRKLSGVIIEEDDEKVMLRIAVKGMKGAWGKVAIRKAHIAEIRRMPAVERQRQEARARGPRGTKGRIPVASASVAGRPGFLAVADLVEVRTTSGEDFAREACDVLMQACDGYLRHFKPLGDAAARLRVTILADRAEYDAYLAQAGGRKVAEPAFFDVEANAVVACCGVPKDEDVRLRAAIALRRAEIGRWREKAAAAEALGKAAVKELKEKAARESAAEKDKLRRERRATPEALREVDQRWASTVDLGIQLARAHEAQAREEAAKATEECERAILSDESLLASRNRAMFEALFHECFHAFARTRLPALPCWLDEGMASYFEASVIEAGELIPGAPNPPLLKLYREAASVGQLPALSSVLRDRGIAVAHEGRIDRSSRSCAVSWVLAHYLCSKATADQMRSYMTAVGGGADPADALAKALGLALAKLDEALRAHASSIE